MLISIGGDGTILRAATLIRDSGIPILGINAGRWGFGNRSKENIDEFLQVVIEKKYTLSKEHY
jgi:NAD+ kinase